MQPIIRIAMTSRVSLSLLVAALAFLVLPSSGTAQAPRRPDLTAAGRDARARRGPLRRGRRADRQARRPRSERRRAQGAVGASRAAGTPTGRSAAAPGRAARADERRGARARAAAADARPRRRRRRSSSGWRRRPTRSRDPQELARAGRALRALGRFQEANAAYRDAATAAPGDAAIQTGMGRAVPREVQQRRGAEIVPDGARRPIRAGRRRCSAPRARSSDDNPPQAVALAKQALEINPSSVDAHVFLAERGRPTPDTHDEAREALREGARRQPVEPRGARAARRARLRRGQAAGVRGRGRRRRWRSRRATARCTASPASWPRTTTASTKRSALTRRALALDAEQPAHARRPRHAPAAHRRRAGARATALDASFKADPVQQARPTTCCR